MTRARTAFSGALTVLLTLLAAALCLGPTMLALRLAVRCRGGTRVAYAVGAVLVALPFLLAVVAAVSSTVRAFDGYCHHAPDIRYPCSLPRAVFEAVAPMSPFSLFGYLLLAAFSCVWGAIVLGPTWWLVRRRSTTPRLPSPR